MAAGSYSFFIEQGATVDFRIDYRSSTGLPVDLTGWDSRMQIRPTVSSTEVIANLSSSLYADGTGLNMTPASASVILPKSSGSIGIFISAATSSLFTFNEAFYDLEIVSGSTNPYVIRILEGKIKLKKNVTR
jgi:hypothetical protein